MGIKMNELSAEIQMKFKMATADGALTAEEWKLFSESEQEQLSAGLGGKAPTEDNPLKIKITTTQPVTQPTKHEEVKEEKSNWFSDWLNDKDKVCTDGKDDGSLSFGEVAESFGKGLMGLVKGIIKHPIATAATIGIGALATVATGGAALPVMIALGVGTGAIMIGKGAYDAATAKTDAEAKAAWERIGNGTFALAASALGAKSSLNAASKAGVTGAEGAKELNTAQALVRNFKVLPNALKVSGQNIKGNVLTLATGNIHAHSNKLLGAEEYYSKPNDVDAYKFNPNGTPEEILANNPHVEQVNGKFGVVDKWKTGDLQKLIESGKSEAEAIKLLKLEPSQVSGGKVYHIADPTKTQMIMQYGEGDFAICEGGVFKESYVDQAAFKQSRARNYQDPANIDYGQRVAVTKQAPGAFKVLPKGTKVQTVSEGVQTVTKGNVVTIDNQGNPYVMPASNMLKRNVGFSDKAMAKLCDIDPTAVHEYQPVWMSKNRFGDFLYVERVKCEQLLAQIESKYPGIKVEHYAGGNWQDRTLSEAIFTYEGKAYYVNIGIEQSELGTLKGLHGNYSSIEDLINKSIPTQYSVK